MYPPAAPTDPGFLRKVVEEVEKGLPHERHRLDDARKNLAFYRGDFSAYRPQPPGDDYSKEPHPRYSLVAQRVVKVLTGDLYRSGPKRSLPDDPGSDAWLASVYRSNGVDSMMQWADRMSVVADVAMFQAAPGPDPARPVRLIPWDASQFCVWVDPDDQCRPVAVALLDLFNEQRRCRLWTAERTLTFVTTEWKPGATAGGTAFVRVKTADNPFGFLPFSWVHFEEPFGDFWTPGIGSYLTSCNEQMNQALTENWASIKYNLRPIVVGRNVRVGWRPPTPVKPGDMWFPPNDPDASGEHDTEPDLSYLQADSSFVAASWDDFQSYLDHVLEMVGVPKSSIRMEQDSVRSGASIQAEQAPLTEWAKSRQRPFSRYEDDLARLVLRVGARHLGSQEYPELGGNYPEYAATSAGLGAAAADLRLTLRWPKMAPEINGVEKVQVDQARLAERTTSRTLIVMERENMTREEAEAYLEEVAEDLKREQELLGGLGETAGDGNVGGDGKKAGGQGDDETDNKDNGEGDDGQQD